MMQLLKQARIPMRASQGKSRQTSPQPGSKKPTILLGVTSSGSLQLLKGFPHYLASRNWDVHVVASGTPATQFSHITTHTIPMQREPNLRSDTRAMLQWIALLLRLRPDVVAVGTPKAGLLGALAALITRRRSRIYVLRGLRLATETGIRRRVLTLMERLAMSAATDVLAVSHSLRAEAADLKLTLPNKITVLGSGSSNGVAIPQSTVLRVMAVERRKELKIPEMPTIGYVGRLHPDKGLRTLFQACKILEEQDIAFQLILVGPEDPPGYFSQALQAYGPKRRLVMNVGPVGDPSPYYRAFDFLCLPTRREGFPNVVLEAAAHGVPTIATEATGCVDAIVDGETGVLVPIDDERQLASAIRLALSDPRGTSSLGLNARSRVVSEFSNHRVWELHEKYYRSKVLK